MAKRIGFLSLNHIHHIYHVAPVAYEMGRFPGVEAVLMCSTREAERVVRRIGAHYPDSRLEIRNIGPRWWQWLNVIRKRSFPRISKLLRKQTDYLMSFDALVSPDFYSNRLVEMRKGSTPRFVFSFHGSGDHEYGFSESLATYDLLLLSGEKIRRRLEANGVLARTSGAVIGYPKFDLVEWFDSHRPSLFNNQRKTVVYNPHFSPHLSSWPVWGLDVLEYFYHSDRYNLVFAPHIMLMHKEDPHRLISEKYFEAPHIHIDTGSESLANMTYTMLADLYLGDVSSQIYEFLYRPRPCLFLNPSEVPWRDDPNYYHWQCGPVLGAIEKLDESLTQAFASHGEYRDVQMRLRNETFDLDPVIRSGRRAAKAIADLVGVDSEPQREA